MVARKNTIIQRLNIIKGQIDGLINLIDNNEDCRKITAQLYAINVAFKKAIELYLRENLTSCLNSLDLKNKKTVDFLLKEILKNK